MTVQVRADKKGWIHEICLSNGIPKLLKFISAILPKHQNSRVKKGRLLLAGDCTE